MQMQIPKYAIFDMDGTLLDSMPMWDTVGSRLLTAHGMDVPDELRDAIKELSTEQSAVYFQQMGLSLSKEQIIKEMYDIAEESYRNHIPLKPHTDVFLQKLKQGGAHLCVATATDSHNIVRAALERLHILQWFDFIVTCADVGCGKNNPAIFLECARRFQSSPEEIVVFEDALYSIKTAKAAGFNVVGVYDASADADTPQIKAVVDRYIESFYDLL